MKYKVSSTATKATDTKTISTTSNTTATKATATSADKTYKVVRGDTLSIIAIYLDTTVAELKQMNNLTSNTIYAGQTLKYKQNSNGSTTTATATASGSVTTKSTNTSTEDQQINAQLKKEVAITKNPSQTGLTKYNQVITEAKKLIGTPYVFGGNGPSGIDCSGYIYYLFNKVGYSLPRETALNYFMLDSTKVTNPIPGDIVYFKNTYIKTISHMGIYLGNNQFIHAASSGVQISSLSNSYWKEHFVAFKRLNVVK